MTILQSLVRRLSAPVVLAVLILAAWSGPLPSIARAQNTGGTEGAPTEQVEEADPFVGYFLAGLIAAGVVFAVSKSARRRIAS